MRNALLLCLFVFAGCESELAPEEGLQRAEAYKNENNVSAAIIELKNTLREHPRHRDARLLLSELFILKRDGKSAETQLHKAKELSPDGLDIRPDLGRALILQQEYDRVLQEVMPEKNDSATVRSDLLTLRGFAYYFLEDLGQAGQVFQDALAANDKNSSIFAGLAMIALDKGDAEEVTKQTEQALTIDGGNMDALFIKGKHAIELKQYLAAEEALRRALASVDNGFAFLRPLQVHATLVQVLISQGKLDEANLAVDELAKKYPNNSMKHYLRAHVAYESGKFEQASEHIKIIRSIAPDYDPALVLEGAINVALGHLEQGNSALTAYLSRHPDSKIARKLLANTRLKLQQPEEAYKLISPLLADDPSNFELLLMAGDAMREAGKPAISIPMLEKALQQEPDNVELKLQLASARLANGETDKAIQIIQSLPATDGKFGKRETMLLLALSRKEDYQAALVLVDDYLQAHPGDADVLGHSGVLLARMGRPDEARDKLEKSLSLKPDNKLTVMALVRLEYQAKNMARAEELLESLLKSEPDNESIIYALANISAERGDKNKTIMWLERGKDVSKKALQPRLLLVKYYLEQGYVDKAKAMSLEATLIAPKSAIVWNAHSVVQNRAGDQKGAIESLRKAEKLAPEDARILMNLAKSQMAMKDVDGATETLAKLLQRSPDNFQAASTLALIEMKRGNTAKALDIVQKQKNVAANRSNALALEGDLRMMTGKFERAIELYQAAAKITPSAALAVKSYAASNRAGHSEPEYGLLQWLHSHPEDVTVRSLLARHYESNGKTVKAIQEYENLSSQKPDDPTVLNNLAMLYLLNNDSKALQTAEKAVKLDPENAAFKDTYGWILVQNKDVKRALPLLRDAMQQLPEYAEIQYHYAVALAESGNRAEARKLLQKVVDSKSNFPALEDAKAYLQTLYIKGP
ncbi:MAG: PEP-CTERM system TPR-repeat protein PrsT [Gammaproteobacteria bacterium]|nr:PEP-CTERM system TPR-repeat protein PrsT [Gammaproteobacteria bacterium]